MDIEIIEGIQAEVPAEQVSILSDRMMTQQVQMEETDDVQQDVSDEQYVTLRWGPYTKMISADDFNNLTNE